MINSLVDHRIGSHFEELSTPFDPESKDIPPADAKLDGWNAIFEKS